MSEVGEGDPPMAGTPDPGAILQMVGEAAYDWLLGSDRLSWSPHAAAALGIADMAALGTGAGFAHAIDAAGGVSRLEAIQASPQSASGGSYEAQYAFKRPDGTMSWLEDIGRWFAGADGK